MYFYRRVRLASWTGRWPLTDEQRVLARIDFRRKPEDKLDGLSIYAVPDWESLALLISAIACERCDEKASIDALFVADEEIALFGEANPTPEFGATPIERVNRLHHSLPWEPDDLDKLADHLLGLRREAIRFHARAIRYVLGALDPVDVGEGPWRAFVEAFKARGRT